MCRYVYVFQSLFENYIAACSQYTTTKGQLSWLFAHIRLHDMTPWWRTPTTLPPHELRCYFEAAIIRRLAGSCCYNRMLWEGIFIQEHLDVCHPWRWQKSCRSCTTAKRDGQSWLGGAYESESHCVLGLHAALTAPVHSISFTQQIPPRWETEELLKQPKQARGQSPSWFLLLIESLRQINTFLKQELWLCMSGSSRERCVKINNFNHARKLFCQSHWVRRLQLSLKTMKNFVGASSGSPSSPWKSNERRLRLNRLPNHLNTDPGRLVLLHLCPTHQLLLACSVDTHARWARSSFPNLFLTFCDKYASTGVTSENSHGAPMQKYFSCEAACWQEVTWPEPAGKRDWVMVSLCMYSKQSKQHIPSLSQRAMLTG